MSPRLEKGKNALISMVCAFLMSAGGALCLTNALFSRAYFPLIAAVCAGGCAVCVGLKTVVRHAGSILLALCAAVLLLGAFGIGFGEEVIHAGAAVILRLRGIETAMNPYQGVIAAAICVILSLISSMIADNRDGLSAGLLAIVVVLPCVWLSGAQNVPGAAMMCCGVGIILCMGERSDLRAMILPAAAVILALIMTPQAVTPNKTLEQGAQKIRDTVEDYVLFTKKRAGFSLKTEGFQPLATRLGGAAAPETHAQLEVLCEEPVYLRAVTYNEYNGLNWYDTVSGRRYLWASRNDAKKNQVFDLSLPKQDIPEKTAEIHVLRDGPTTLYLPERTRTLTTSGERMVVYFSDAGEAFLTRNTAVGDTYICSYQSLSDVPEEGEIPGEIRKTYLTLPIHMQSEVYELVSTVTARAQTAREKAQAIADYLADEMEYTLQVDAPPDNVDFVTWFLLREKKGYCTYFASACTVMCRMAGIPARYVTGYLTDPENGVATVTGEDAHAWTEIYLAGVGWVPLDATPRGRTQKDPPQNPAPTNSPAPAPLPTNSSEPTNSPEPSASPDQDDNQGQDEQDSEEQNPEDENPEEQNPEEQPPEEQNDEQNPEQNPEQKKRAFPWVLLILALAVMAFAVRVILTEPVRRAQRHPQMGAVILGGAILQVLSMMGYERKKQETLVEFASRIPLSMPLSFLAADYSAMLYGGHDTVDLVSFAECYKTLRARLPLEKRLLLTLKRVFHP